MKKSEIHKYKKQLEEIDLKKLLSINRERKRERGVPYMKQEQNTIKKAICTTESALGN